MAVHQHHNPQMIPGDLPSHWRQRAQLLADYGDPNSARLWQLAAVELEQVLHQLGEDTLTLVEAARFSGYTADHLGSLVRQGKLPNYGCRNAPRLRRIDLPIKASSPDRPPRPKASTDEGGAGITQIATKLRG